MSAMIVRPSAFGPGEDFSQGVLKQVVRTCRLPGTISSHPQGGRADGIHGGYARMPRRARSAALLVAVTRLDLLT